MVVRCSAKVTKLAEGNSQGHPRELSKLGSFGVGQSETPWTTLLKHLMLDVSTSVPDQGDIEVQAMVHSGAIANFMDLDFAVQ